MISGYKMNNKKLIAFLQEKQMRKHNLKRPIYSPIGRQIHWH